MARNWVFFIYGMCVLFYGMMAWFFWRKGSDRLSRLVMFLMGLICVQCVKDVFFLPQSYELESFPWMVQTSVDMIAEPLYAFILIELCRPGWLTWRTMLLHELPFVVLPVIFILTREPLVFDIETVWAAIYGMGWAIWTMFAIPRYHASMRKAFSYDENINLNWLRIILFSYFIIFALWLLVCYGLNLELESVYMLCSMVIWMFVCYFIYKHESVIEELAGLAESLACNSSRNIENGSKQSRLSREISRLFNEQQIYLIPDLKLSDVARMAGSNRTYVSKFFNQESGTSFYEYVNGFRISHAERLLRDTGDKIDCIAAASGFNSRQAFHRVFSRMRGCTPEEFRASSGR